MRQWALVFVATMCGIVAAYNVGKVSAALPVIRQEFSPSLFSSGALASSYSVTAMLFAVGFGLLVSRVGVWRVAATGLCLLAAAGVLGASAGTYALLLTSRLLEGFGFVAVAVSMPAFIGRVCGDHIRPMAMGVWGAFIPTGVTVSLLLSPFLLQAGGWRAVWWAGSAAALVMCVVALFTIRPAHRAMSAASVQARPQITSVFRRQPLLLAACFGLYSCTFVAVTTFLPTFWVESVAMTPGSAARLSAAVVVMNILGNLTGGWLCSRGVALRPLLAIALFGGGLSACLVFYNGLPVAGQVIAACCCTCLSGILPATLFANVAKIAPTPAHSGLIVGLFFQGASLGQVFGPALFGGLLDFFGGWNAAPVLFISVMLAAAVLLWYVPANQETVAENNER